MCSVLTEYGTPCRNLSKAWWRDGDLKRLTGDSRVGGEVGAIFGKAGFSIGYIGWTAFDAVDITSDRATERTDFVSL